jgi:hypothetical protein
MAGEINFGLLNTNAPLMVANAYSEGKKNRIADLLAQKQERDFADEDAVREAYKTSGGDQNALMKNLYAVGNYKAANDVQKQQLDISAKQAQVAKSMSDVAHQKTIMYRDALSNVNTPDDARTWLQAQYQDKDVAPIINSLSPIDKAMAYIPNDPQGFEQWKQKAALGMTKFTEMNKPSIHTQNNGATNDIVAVPGLGGTPSVLSSSRVSISPGQAAQLAQSDRHFKAQQENSKTGGLGSIFGSAPEATSPETAPIVQAIIEGRKALTPSEMKSPYGQGLLALVAQKDPSFDLINYNARAKMRNDAVAGKTAENIKAINTAIAHVGQLNDQMTALGNTDSAAYNTAANWLGSNVGMNKDLQGKMSSVDTTAEGVAGEMAKVFRSTGMSEGEINAWRKKFNTNTTPGAQQGVMQSAMHMLQGRMEAINDQYQKGMGTTAQPLQLLTPQSQKIFDRLSGKSSAQNQPYAQPSGNQVDHPSDINDLLKKYGG